MKRVVFGASVRFTKWFFRKLIKKIFTSTQKHKSVSDINKNWESFNFGFGYQRIYDGYEPNDMQIEIKAVITELEEESSSDSSSDLIDYYDE